MSTPSATSRMPVVYLPHGGGPWPFVDLPLGAPEELAPLAEYLRSLRALPVVRPAAVLVVSAHWEEKTPTVMSGAHPPLLFDYYGFPKAAYELTWPAPGDPALAARVRELLTNAGFETASNGERGFDHGAFVPLKLTFPDADVPTVQLSLERGLDPKRHLAMGRALAPLRDEGVFIVGSGMSYHNMRGFGGPGARASEAFDAWLTAAATAPSGERDEKLIHWDRAPAARESHPREEHLLPLHVVAGAAGDDIGRVGYQGRLMGTRISGYHFG
ncbi:MAG TPA: class III extradiol ring-cleavage dioxygenase [Polyangiaceae bacterium]|nr:class III extradiol ring-cleavage dioxygenase [Polyangiaceae bacterium]